jgi:formylglycine-generating enzyme required for sulfatase activity
MRHFIAAFRIIVVIAILALMAILTWDLDIILRAYHALREGTFTVERLRYEIASLDIGRPSPVVPVATKISTKDGMIQLFVPAGEFEMGDEGQKFYLDAFWIDQVEVTNAMYQKCVGEEACTIPVISSDPYYGKWAYRDCPIVYVDWFQANQYCEWTGRKLPTEAQWEKAARGTDGRKYPWGNTKPNPRLVNYKGSLIGELVSSFRYPLGQSPYGALNMVGNVREWVADWYSPTYYRIAPYMNPTGPATGFERSLRSGAYDADANEIMTYFRYRHEPRSAGLSRGFRCAENGE